MTVVVRSGLSVSLQAMADRVALAAPEGSLLMALALEASIKAEIKGGHPKGTKTGAKPGGPPQNISGNLRRSVITSHPHTLGPGRAETKVGPTTVYARAQELGHPRWKSGVKYPFVKPGVRHAEESGQLHVIASETLARAIRG